MGSCGCPLSASTASPASPHSINEYRTYHVSPGRYITIKYALFKQVQLSVPVVSCNCRRHGKKLAAKLNLTRACRSTVHLPCSRRSSGGALLEPVWVNVIVQASVWTRAVRPATYLTAGFPAPAPHPETSHHLPIPCLATHHAAPLRAPSTRNPRCSAESPNLRRGLASAGISNRM